MEGVYQGSLVEHPYLVVSNTLLLLRVKSFYEEHNYDDYREPNTLLSSYLIIVASDVPDIILINCPGRGITGWNVLFPPTYMEEGTIISTCDGEAEQFTSENTNSELFRELYH